MEKNLFVKTVLSTIGITSLITPVVVFGSSSTPPVVSANITPPKNLKLSDVITTNNRDLGTINYQINGLGILSLLDKKGMTNFYVDEIQTPTVGQITPNTTTTVTIAPKTNSYHYDSSTVNVTFVYDPDSQKHHIWEYINSGYEPDEDMKNVGQKGYKFYISIQQNFDSTDKVLKYFVTNFTTLPSINQLTYTTADDLNTDYFYQLTIQARTGSNLYFEGEPIIIEMYNGVKDISPSTKSVWTSVGGSRNEYTSDTGYTLSSKDSWAEHYEIKNIFDGKYEDATAGKVGNIYASNGEANQKYFTLKFPSEKKIAAFSLVTRGGNGTSSNWMNQTPKNWILEGSETDSSTTVWKEICNGSTKNPGWSKLRFVFTIKNLSSMSAYQYYRFRIIDSWTTNQNFASIDEFKFFGI